MSTEKNQTTQSKSLTISQTTILLCITLGIFHLNGPFRVIFDLSVNIHPCMCACYPHEQNENKKKPRKLEKKRLQSVVEEFVSVILLYCHNSTQ